MGSIQARLDAPEPFEWDACSPLPPEAIQVWNELAKNLKNGTQGEWLVSGSLNVDSIVTASRVTAS
jgi:hypothetical protein